MVEYQTYHWTVNLSTGPFVVLNSSLTDHLEGCAMGATNWVFTVVQLGDLTQVAGASWGRHSSKLVTPQLWLSHEEINLEGSSEIMRIGLGAWSKQKRCAKQGTVKGLKSRTGSGGFLGGFPNQILTNWATLRFSIGTEVVTVSSRNKKTIT